MTNIAAGPPAHTRHVVDFIPTLSLLMKHADGAVRTQAAWTIGNIVGDREGYRDFVLEGDTLKNLLNIWHGDFQDSAQQKEAFRIAMWVVDNMCRYKPNWHQVFLAHIDDSCF